MKFEEIDFYDYKIRMCLDNGIRMYLVSDLLRQYNEKHGTNKRFKKYLENKQTQELIEHMAKSVGPNSGLRSEGENSAKNSHSTVGSDLSLLSNEGQNGKFDICDVIQYITTSSTVGTNKGYIICEELLHACLMWADPAFACDVYRFLTRLRQEDNDYLRKVNEELKQEVKELKNRFVPDEKKEQWIHLIAIGIDEEKITIYSKYRNMNDMRQLMNELKRDNLAIIYRTEYIPSGSTFRRKIYDYIKNICDEYNGIKNDIHSFSIPLSVWNDKQEEIKKSIEDQVKQIRKELCWRPELDKDHRSTTLES